MVDGESCWERARDPRKAQIGAVKAIETTNLQLPQEPS